MRTWWYLSFADDHFLGGAFIFAADIQDAARDAHNRGINPGGEILCAQVPPGYLPDESDRNRLLTRGDIMRIWPDAITLKEAEEEGLSPDPKQVSFLCADCAKGTCITH